MFFVGLFSSFTPYIILLVGYLVFLVTLSVNNKPLQNLVAESDVDLKIIEAPINKTSIDYEKTFDYADFYLIADIVYRNPNFFNFQIRLTLFLKKIFPVPLSLNVIHSSFINLPPPSLI